jgi:hypothetical protein
MHQSAKKVLQRIEDSSAAVGTTKLNRDVNHQDFDLGSVKSGILAGYKAGFGCRMPYLV